jgi:flagellar hook-length control protein FliK
LIAGLVKNTGPTLNVPVPDSKDRNLEQKGNKFSDVLDSKSDRNLKKDDVVKTEPEKTRLSPESVRRKATEVKTKVQSQEDSENQTEGPPDPKVMDPRISALREQRDRAIRKFMDSFESEFGVPPEEMVEAMSQLTTQDLEKPPEKTVDNLIAKLNLPAEDEAKAKQMYMGLVLQLKQIDTKVAMPIVQNDLLSQMSAQRVQLSADKKELLGTQVKNLSDKFWMKGEHAQSSLTPEMNQLQVREFLKKMVTAESAGTDLDAEAIMEANPELTTSTESLLKQLKAENLDESDSASEDSGDLELQNEIGFTPEFASTKATSQKSAGGESQNQDQQSDSALAGALQVKQKGSISQEAVQAEFKKMGIKPIEATQGSKKIAKGDVEAMLNLDPGSLSQKNFETLKSAIPALNVQPMVDMTPAQKTENIQQIMNQAQILLKNGGGEVKVEMSPEGMGNIQLKLQVLDGKVQMHMSTETKEAKKLIETSINELKQSLAAQQLSMENVKVDVVHHASSSQGPQNDLQNQMQNFLNHQQRDGTKQFWQQFNENFGNRQARDNLYDAQNIGAPARSQTLPGLDRVSSNSRARSDGRGKSLNLVA